MRKTSTGYLFECYIWFVNTIARGPVSREAIDNKWVHASVNDYKTDSIPESTFHRWRNTVELLFDLKIKCNSRGEYYIEEAADIRRTNLRSRMLNLLSVNSLLKDCQDLRKQILFEPILSIFIKSYRSELFLLLAIDITGFVENGFDLLRLCIKVIAQRFERVEFFIPKQHIDARY